MDIASIVDTIVQFFSAHTIIAIVILIVAGGLIYVKPKAMAKLAAIILAAGAIYGIVNMLWGTTFTGVSNKNKMVDTEPADTEP